VLSVVPSFKSVRFQQGVLLDAVRTICAEHLSSTENGAGNTGPVEGVCPAELFVVPGSIVEFLVFECFVYVSP